MKLFEFVSSLIRLKLRQVSGLIIFLVSGRLTANLREAYFESLSEHLERECKKIW